MKKVQKHFIIYSFLSKIDFILLLEHFGTQASQLCADLSSLTLLHVRTFPFFPSNSPPKPTYLCPAPQVWTDTFSRGFENFEMS